MPEFPSTFSETSFFSSFGCTVKGIQIIPMYFCEDFFFPKGIILQSTNHLPSAGTHTTSEILCSHIFLNYPSLFYSSSMCSRKKVALHTNLHQAFLIYWKLLKQLLPIRRISRIFYRKKHWKREFWWWLIGAILSECWNPFSVSGEPHPDGFPTARAHAWTMFLKMCCLALVFLQAVWFQSFSLVSCLKDIALPTRKKTFNLRSKVWFQGRKLMQISSISDCHLQYKK